MNGLTKLFLLSAWLTLPVMSHTAFALVALPRGTGLLVTNNVNDNGPRNVARLTRPFFFSIAADRPRLGLTIWILYP